MASKNTSSKSKLGPDFSKKRTYGLTTYFVLLAVQTAGAAMVLINAVPIYRQVVLDFSHHQSQPGILLWAVASVLLIQSAYWLRVKLQPPLPTKGNAFVGHIASFVARISFAFTNTTFLVVFINRFDDLTLSVWRIIGILVVLFSLSCWTLELERLAKALHGPKWKP